MEFNDYSTVLSDPRATLTTCNPNYVQLTLRATLTT